MRSSRPQRPGQRSQGRMVYLRAEEDGQRPGVSADGWQGA